MKSTTKDSCICGSEVELDLRHSQVANVFWTCPEHGTVSVSRSSLDALIGLVRPPRGVVLPKPKKAKKVEQNDTFEEKE